MKAHLLIAGLVALIPTAAMADTRLVLPWWISAAVGDGQSQCRAGYVSGQYFLQCEQVPPVPTPLPTESALGVRIMRRLPQ